MITVVSALREGTARLHGPDAALEARLLLAHAMDVPRDRLILMMSDEVSLYAWNTYCLCIENRLAQMPISRIIGRRALWGRDFIVTPDVLHPRPDRCQRAGDHRDRSGHARLDHGIAGKHPWRDSRYRSTGR